MDPAPAAPPGPDTFGAMAPRLLEHPRTPWWLIALHLLLLAMLMMKQCLLTDKEALKYVGCAEAVLNGDPGDLLGSYRMYGAYVLYLLPFVAVGLPALAVIGQVVLGVMASLALARLVGRVAGSVAAGHAAMGLLLLCPLVHTWTLALYTEAFFTAASILFVGRVAQPGRLGAWGFALAAIVLFARPIGVLFVAPVLAWKLGGVPALVRRNWFFPVACVAILAAVIAWPGIPAPQMEPIVAGQVIAGIGGDPQAAIGFEGRSIGSAQRHLFDRLGAVEWAGLMVRRAASLYTLPRPYYSVLHNLVNAAWMLLFPLALAGFWRHRHHRVVRLIGMLLVMHTALVGLTHDEWSGRFIVPLLPWVIALAVLAVNRPTPES